MTRKTHLLLILDGFGYREASDHNAVALAKAPTWRSLWANQPHTLLQTHGLAVGLPDDQMGNSEVGHMNLGAGRVVYQELTRINLAIEDGSFFSNVALVNACTSVKPGNTLHLLALISDGGVHSHQDHVHAMLRLAAQQGVADIAVHAFLDGRDTPPKSASAFLAALQLQIEQTPGARLSSVAGRYYAMDRDRRYDRLELAYRAIVDAHSEHHADHALAALAQAYARGENDEFVLPTVIGKPKPMADGDAVIFLNFRADRARQLSAALLDPVHNGLSDCRQVQLATFTTLTSYAEDLAADVAFQTDTLRNTLPAVLAGLGKTQLRIAETEKYAHVTFFFSGGVEAPYPGESRILIPSPKVATYDLQPAMSCPELSHALCKAIRSGDFDLIICNIANPDMVGHTGKLDAAIAAVEAVDQALTDIVAAVEDIGGVMLITADHGNLEEMWDAQSNQPNTQHSLNPVPLVAVGTGASRLHDGGSLRDIAPTLLDLMGLAQPAEMTGRSLINRTA